MAGRRTAFMDIRNLLRHLQASPNISAIQRATGLNRRTIMRYRTRAEQHNLLGQPLPSLEELQHLVATTLQPMFSDMIFWNLMAISTFRSQPTRSALSP